MIVQRVVMPVTEAVSWTVLDDGVPVEPAEKYLAYLAALERSPNTVRAYALSLRLWFEFLGAVGVDWAAVGVEDVARFVSWLRAPAENVIVLDTGTARRSAATVNRHLAAVFGFYDHHARAGVEVAADLVVWRRVGRGSYKPLLHHVTKGRPIPTRPVKADLRTAIIRLRRTDGQPAPATAANQRASSDSLRQRLDATRNEIAQLRAENTRLREQVARSLGEQRARR